MNSDDQLVVLDGSSFFVSGRNGDCPPGQETGCFHQDVRHLSIRRVRVVADGLHEDLVVENHGAEST